MARKYVTRDWHNETAPSLDEMGMIVREAYAYLPKKFHQLTGDIQIEVSDFPSEEIIESLGLETPFDLLGLFEGRGIAGRWNPNIAQGANRLTLFRRAILEYWCETDETLGEIIKHVLIHEIGHHFGLSDEDMLGIEAQEA